MGDEEGEGSDPPVVLLELRLAMGELDVASRKGSLPVQLRSLTADLAAAGATLHGTA